MSISLLFIKNYRRLTGLVCFILIFNPYTFGNHTIGAEISYTSTGIGTYVVTMKWYRTCNGAVTCNTVCPGDCPIDLYITGKTGVCNGTNFGSVGLTFVSSTPVVDAFQLCSGLKSYCTNCGTRTAGTYSPGMEIYTFQGTLNTNSLPASCCEIALSLNTCCRSYSITTLANAGAVSLYTEAIINRCITSSNSSPVFSTPAAVATCANQNFYYNMGATDPDGDSLSYGLATALSNPWTPVPYLTGYSASVPFPTYTGIVVDAVSGDIRFKPAGSFQAPFVIEIKQWRKINNVLTLVGITRRDIDFISLACAPNNLPEFKTFKNNVETTPLLDYSFCAGQSNCITIAGYDMNHDTTTLSWNSPTDLVQKGATFLPAYSGAKPDQDSFKFCWTPSVSHINNNKPYYFILTCSDNKCEIPGKILKTFSVTVNVPVIAQITKFNTYCKVFSFGFNRMGPKTGYKKWDIENQPGSNSYSSYFGDSIFKHSFLQQGIHKIRLTLSATPSNCETIIEDTVLVPNLGFGLSNVTPNNIIGDSIICKNKAYTFYSDTINGAYAYQWQLPLGWTILSGQGTNKIDIITGNSEGIIELKLFHNCDTSLIRTLTVSIYPDPITPTIIYGNETPCRGSEQNYYSNVVNGVLYLWQVPSGCSIVSGQGTNLLKVMIGSTPGPIILRTIVGCDTSGAGILLIKPFAAVKPNSIDGDSIYCPGASKSYSITGIAGGHTYLWTLPAGWNIISGQGYGNIITNVSGNGGIIKVKAIFGCDTSSALEKTVNLVPKPLISQNILGPDSITGVGSTHLFNIMPEPRALSYTWQVPSGWSINSGQGTPNLTLSNNNSAGTIWLKMNFECNYKDSLSKYITYQNPSASSGKLLYEQDFSFYPNPSNGIIIINYRGIYSGTYKMSILTVDGKEVYAKTIDFDVSNTCQISLDMLSSGTYFLKIQGTCGQWQKPILLIK